MIILISLSMFKTARTHAHTRRAHRFSLLSMVFVPIICFRVLPFLKAIMENVLKVHSFDLPLICAASVLLEFVLDLVTRDYNMY